MSNAPTGTGFKSIAGNIYNGYALRSDGSIAAWGNDAFGQVSNVPTGIGFTALGGGGAYQAYAIRSDGSIAAWGYDGSGAVSNTPTGTGYTAVAGGEFNGYALHSVAAVPEPSSLVLCLGGASLAGSFAWRRRRQLATA